MFLRKAFQAIRNGFKSRAILSACRANNVERLRETLPQQLSPSDEGIITEETLLACLQDGRQWRMHGGKFTGSALDCASLVMAYSLRLKILTSGLLPSQDLQPDSQEQPRQALSTLLGKAFGGLADLDRYLSPENFYFDYSRQQHMLVLMSAALLGYERIIESCQRLISCQPLFLTTDWIMLATVAGHDEMVVRIVAGNRPSFYSDSAVVLFPYLLTLAEVFGRDLRGTLNVFTQHYQNPCGADDSTDSMNDYLNCVVKFVSSCAPSEPIGLLAWRPKPLLRHAEFLLDVDSSYKLRIHPAYVSIRSDLDSFLPHLYTTRSRPAQPLCLRIFQRLCDLGAGGWFLLDVEHWWNHVHYTFLHNLVYFLVESVHAACRTSPPRGENACELCACPITSFMLYVEKRLGNNQDPMRDRLESAGLANSLQELAGYIGPSGLQLLRRGDGQMCAQHLNHYSGNLAQLGGSLLRRRGVPSLKVSALVPALQEFGSRDNPNYKVLLKFCYLDYVDDLKKELNRT